MLSVRLVGKEFAQHAVIEHQKKEYVSRANPEIHTNTIEGFFSVFKRGMKGIYHHCAHNHLHRYLAEFDFRYKTIGRRLAWKTSNALTSCSKASSASG